VPVSSIQRVVPQIIKTGRAEQIGLGIRIDVEQRFERRAGIRGVIVIGVQPGSPAAKAGLRGVETTDRGVVLGDIIVGIGQTVIADYDDLYNTLDRHQAGEKVKLKVKRGNKLVELETELVVVQ
jgi:S1-C subfamily serine protease